MAKEVRRITASADVAAIIDRGSEVDTQIKNLTFEDKGLKLRIGEFVGSSVKEGETSIRIAGNKAAASVSLVEKYTLDSSSETFKEVQKATVAGLLDGVVERERELAVPVADLDKAVTVLKKAGINAVLVESFSVNANGYREALSPEKASTQTQDVMNALKDCVSKETSYRVKYERV